MVRALRLCHAALAQQADFYNVQSECVQRFARVARQTLQRRDLLKIQLEQNLRQRGREGLLYWLRVMHQQQKEASTVISEDAAAGTDSCNIMADALMPDIRAVLTQPVKLEFEFAERLFRHCADAEIELSQQLVAEANDSLTRSCVSAVSQQPEQQNASLHNQNSQSQILAFQQQFDVDLVISQTENLASIISEDLQTKRVTANQEAPSAVEPLCEVPTDQMFAVVGARPPIAILPPPIVIEEELVPKPSQLLTSLREFAQQFSMDFAAYVARTKSSGNQRAAMPLHAAEQQESVYTYYESYYEEESEEEREYGSSYISEYYSYYEDS